jgi:hypothetical protein
MQSKPRSVPGVFGVRLFMLWSQESALLGLIAPVLRVRDHSKQMFARFLDTREIPFMTCACGEIQDFGRINSGDGTMLYGGGSELARQML